MLMWCKEWLKIVIVIYLVIASDRLDISWIHILAEFWYSGRELLCQSTSYPSSPFSSNRLCCPFCYSCCLQRTPQFPLRWRRTGPDCTAYNWIGIVGMAAGGTPAGPQRVCNRAWLYPRMRFSFFRTRLCHEFKTKFWFPN